ncbi:T-cell receptor beta-1 chain C region [Channa argus]|nr:T-cell receptor beta-1 chain C region [Channa argus]
MFAVFKGKSHLMRCKVRVEACWAVLRVNPVHCDSGVGEAYFGGGTKLTVIEDGIKITPPTVTLLRPSKKECRDPRDNQRKKTLVCVASGFYPDHVTVRWKFNGRDETDNVATDAAAVKKGNFYSITSRFRVSADDWFNPDNKFTCIVSFYDSSNHIIKEAFLHGDKPEDSPIIIREKYMMISQRAKLSYGVFIVKSCMYGAFAAFLVWKLQGSAGK